MISTQCVNEHMPALFIYFSEGLSESHLTPRLNFDAFVFMLTQVVVMDSMCVLSPQRHMLESYICNALALGGGACGR